MDAYVPFLEVAAFLSSCLQAASRFHSSLLAPCTLSSREIKDDCGRVRCCSVFMVLQCLHGPVEGNQTTWRISNKFIKIQQQLSNLATFSRLPPPLISFVFPSPHKLPFFLASLTFFVSSLILVLLLRWLLPELFFLRSKDIIIVNAGAKSCISTSF